jgi:FkbM family methyltransferase
VKERGFTPSLVVDVGTAIGSWTLLVARFWPTARFVMVETPEERREQLEAVRMNCGGQIQVFICGLADRDGKLKMGVSQSLFDSSFAYDCEKVG